MAIPNYIRPQAEIHQMLTTTLQVTNGALAACIVGPQYDLYRYGKEDLKPHTFSADTQDIPFEFSQDFMLDYAVDTSSVDVYAEGLEASLATFSKKITVDKDDITVIRLPEGELFASTNGQGLASELSNYGVQIGDVIVVTDKADGGTVRKRRVLDIVGKKVPASVKAQVVPGIETEATIALNSAADTYTATVDTTYLLVADGKGGLAVTDSAGIDIAVTITPEDSTPVKVGTRGVEVQFTNVESLKAGDTFSVVCHAAGVSEKEFDGLRLSSMPVAAKFDRSQKLEKVELRKMFSGQLNSDSGLNEAYTVSDAGVKVNEGLSLWIDDQQKFAPFVDKVGSLYLQFRVLVMPLEDEEKFTVHNDLEVQEALGTIDQWNDVAYAASVAVDAAAGREVYVIRTRGTDFTAFLEAVQKTQTDSDTYSFCVVSDDIAIFRDVADYNETLCAPDVMKFRRTFWGCKLPGDYTFFTKDVNDLPLRATFSAPDGDSNSTNNVLVQIDEECEIDLKEINFNGTPTALRRGDKIKLLVTGKDYIVQEVLSSKEVRLVAGPATEITDAPTEIALIHTSTAQNNKEYVQSACSNRNNKRCTVVWSDEAKLDGKVVENKYLAAYVAGLASSVLPNQSLTRSEVTCVSSATRMYSKYSREDLDDIARYGCLIITQNTKTEPCYVRHNLTTETDKGLLYYEESCIRNIDNMSFGVQQVIEPLIGKANVTPTALRTLRERLIVLFQSYMNDSVDPLIGPSLINYENLTVQQDPLLMSRVDVKVDWYIPAPLNNIRVYPMVFVGTVQI